MRKYVLLAEGLGASEAEVCRITSGSFSVSAEGKRIDSKEYDFSDGFGIRVIKKGRVGFSFFQKGGDSKGAIKRAISLSRFSRESSFSFPSDPKYPKVRTFDRRIGDLEADDAIRMLRETLSSLSPHAKASKSGFDFGTTRVRIENSSGLSTESLSSEASCFSNCTAGKSSGSSFRSSLFLDFDPSVVGKEASERAIEMIKGKPIRAGALPVVFEPEALCSLFYSLLLPSFHGERAYRKISRLHDKLGEKIAPSSLSISDDPLCGAPSSSSFDGEGKASEIKFLLKQGEVSNFLFDSRTASLAKAYSPKPGNSRRRSYDAEPGVGASNISVGAGKDKNAMEGMKEGLLACSVFGEHTSNELTGEFSVSVDRGFRIRNGDKGEPSRGNVLSGNIFDLIAKITAIEKKRERYGDFISPRMAFKDIQVVG